MPYGTALVGLLLHFTKSKYVEALKKAASLLYEVYRAFKVKRLEDLSTSRAVNKNFSIFNK